MVLYITTETSDSYASLSTLLGWTFVQFDF